ncbi:hypothetical protein BH09PSE5_BH09PSE5_03420 [soil metagenome]
MSIKVGPGRDAMPGAEDKDEVDVADAARSAAPTDVFLCGDDQLPEGGSLAVTVPASGRDTTILLARRQGAVHAWLDHCPHTGMSLRWDPRPFATADGRFLECASHSALFRVTDGVCVRGPCKDERLTARSVETRNRAIWLVAVSPGSAAP